MSVVIRIQWLAGGTTFAENVDGQYVKTFNPDAFDGRGAMTATPKIEDAIHFPDAGAAMEFYRQTSTIRPLREDGKPNRPLTAFTVSIERVTE